KPLASRSRRRCWRARMRSFSDELPRSCRSSDGLAAAAPTVEWLQPGKGHQNSEVPLGGLHENQRCPGKRQPPPRPPWASDLLLRPTAREGLSDWVLWSHSRKTISRPPSMPLRRPGLVATFGGRVSGTRVYPRPEPPHRVPVD